MEIRLFLSSVLNFFSFSFSSPFDSRLCVQTVGKFPFLMRSSLQPPHSTRSVSLTNTHTYTDTQEGGIQQGLGFSLVCAHI